MKSQILLILCVFLSLYASAQNYAETIQHYRETKHKTLMQRGKGPIADEYINHVQYFEPANKFNIIADVQLLLHEPSFRMPTSDGTSKEFKRFALLSFHIDNQHYQLTAYENVDRFQISKESTYLFLPFLDLTTGNSSYESGRYLDLKKEDIQSGQLAIDFNKAYNPYCAYSDGYRCPQPPLENFLNIEIKAGEKKYTGPKNHKKQNIAMARNFTQEEKDIILSGDSSEKMYVLQTTVEQDSITLRTISEDIKPDDPLLTQLLDRMMVTVQNTEQTGVGIAAPQVGINKNIIWVQRFDKPEQPFEYFLNPKITWRSKLLRKGTEGCLSIPEQRDDVLRNYSIRLEYMDKQGNPITELVEGFTAVIFQHEVDHLYGILFPDRNEEDNKTESTLLNEHIEFYITDDLVIP